MTPTLKDLRVQPGDDVRAAWERLLAYEKSRQVIAGAGIRVKQMPEGIYLTAEPGGSSRHFAHPWRPQISAALQATITAGTVNGAFPRLGSVTLDGKDSEGNPAPVPPLDLTETKPDEEGRSWIVLLATPDPADEALAAYTIAHRNVLGNRPIAGQQNAAEGIHPLVALLWTGSKITGRFQVTHHHLGHAYRPPAHYFWGL